MPQFPGRICPQSDGRQSRLVRSDPTTPTFREAHAERHTALGPKTAPPIASAPQRGRLAQSTNLDRSAAAPTAKLSDSQEASSGPSASVGPNRVAVEEFAGLDEENLVRLTEDVADVLKAASPEAGQRSPPPQYPASEASSSFRPAPPPFSSLFAFSAPEADLDPDHVLDPYKPTVSDATLSPSLAAPAYAPLGPGSGEQSTSFQDETKRALPRDTKREGASSRSKDDDAEPPPAYSEGSSPLLSFTYLMATAGGASSIITQVQQGGPPINAIGGATNSAGARCPRLLTLT